MRRLFAGFGLLALLIASDTNGQTSVYTPGNGVIAPRVVRRVRPVYPASAEKARRQGSAMLECVVATNGTVSGVSVARASDQEFSDAAVAAAWQYRFSPGMKDGQPVAVRIPLELVFTLR